MCENLKKARCVQGTEVVGGSVPQGRLGLGLVASKTLAKDVDLYAKA